MRCFTLDDPPFAGRTGRGVTVAVLDSGIHAPHPHVGGIQGGVSFIKSDSSSDTSDRLGHGTAIAAAIREKSPDVALLAVKIFDARLATNIGVLTRAIVWAADNGATLINLSLGTPNPAHAGALAEVVKYAGQRGAVVISASDSDGAEWLPGSLHGVAGVRADPSCARDAVCIETRPGELPRFHASIYPRPIPGVPPERNLSGLSFAVANVTGFLARLVEGASAPPHEVILSFTEPR